MILYIACLLQLLFVFSGASPHDLTTGSTTEASTLTLKNAVDEKGLCKVNGSFPLDCNTCICVIGSHPACTLMGCISLVPTPPGVTCEPGSTTDCSTQTKVRPKRSNEKLNAGGKCKPGDKWKLDECNDCVCTHTGYASCTLNDCSPAKGSNKGRPKRSGGSSDKLSAGGKCKPGDKWKLDECNDCVCTHTGYASCTLNDCSPAKGSNKNRPKRSGGSSDKLSAGGKCKPGDKWKLDECNNCVCTHTGYASCTLNDCSPAKGSGKGRSKRSGESSGKLQPGGRCKPGDKWDLDECNKCVCTHTGYASCSLNDCGKGKGRGKRSSDGSRYSDYVDSQGKCKGKATFKMDCNSCHCSQNGQHPLCTLMTCPETEMPRITRDTSQRGDLLNEFGICQVSGTFKVECNVCHCTKGRSKTCTNRKCSGSKTSKVHRVVRDARNENGNSGLDCKPGISWKESCNSCFCSERGIAMCTDIPTCPSPPPAPGITFTEPTTPSTPSPSPQNISSTTENSIVNM